MSKHARNISHYGQETSNKKMKRVKVVGVHMSARVTVCLPQTTDVLYKVLFYTMYTDTTKQEHGAQRETGTIHGEIKPRIGMAQFVASACTDGPRVNESWQYRSHRKVFPSRGGGFPRFVYVQSLYT